MCYLSVDHTACVLSLTHASCDWQVRSPHGEQGGERLRLREGGGRGRRERGRERRRRERERESGGNLKSLKPIWTWTQVCVSQEFIPPIILISGRARGGVRKSGPESKWGLVQGSRFREQIAVFMLYVYFQKLSIHLEMMGELQALSLFKWNHLYNLREIAF